MNLSNFNTLLSLMFAPTFVLAMQYFDFKIVAFSYTILMFLYLIMSIILKQDLKKISTPIIYFSFVLVAYIYASMAFIKMIPALISFSFFTLFLFGYINKKSLIFSFTNQFYKKKLDESTQSFLKNSDGYWALVLFINTVIQILLVFTKNNEIWAFYSSVGWYIYLFVAFLMQVTYEKIFVKKRLIQDDKTI